MLLLLSALHDFAFLFLVLLETHDAHLARPLNHCSDSSEANAAAQSDYPGYCPTTTGLAAACGYFPISWLQIHGFGQLDMGMRHERGQAWCTTTKKPALCGCHMPVAHRPHAWTVRTNLDSIPYPVAQTFPDIGSHCHSSSSSPPAFTVSSAPPPFAFISISCWAVASPHSRSCCPRTRILQHVARS